MPEPRARPDLRLVESGPRPSVLGNPGAVRDFARVCRQVGILDPDTGLIRPPQRGDINFEG
jgi:hypothetical protein